MASTNRIAPGVYTVERDFSDYIASFASTSLGLVGTARKGPLNKDVLITSPERFLETFGTPDLNKYGPTAALNYLRNGNQLHYVRVARQYNTPYTPDAFADVPVGAEITFDGSVPSVGSYLSITEPGKLSSTNVRVVSVAGQVATVTPLNDTYDEDVAVVMGDADAGAASKAESAGVTRSGGSVAPLVIFRANSPGQWANFASRQGIEIHISDGGAFSNVDPTTGSPFADSQGVALQGVLPTADSIDDGEALFSLTSSSAQTGQVRGVNRWVPTYRVISITDAGVGGNVTFAFNSVSGIESGTKITVKGAHDVGYNKEFTVSSVDPLTKTVICGGGIGVLIPTNQTAAIAQNLDAVAIGVAARCEAATTTSSTWVPVGVHTKRVVVFYEGKQVEMFDNLIGYDPDSPNFWESAIGTESDPKSAYITVEYVGVGEQPVNTRQSHVNNPRILLGASLVARIEDDPASPSTTFTMSKGADGDFPTSADFVGTVGVHGSRTGLQVFREVESVDVNLLAVPGQFSANVINALIEVLEARADCLGIVDPPFGLTLQEAVEWHNGAGAYTGSHSAFVTNKAALFYPWTQHFDPYNNRDVWLPPSAVAPGAIAASDEVGEVWYAPAGITRGRVVGAKNVEVRLNRGDVEYMYGPGNGNAINPIQLFARDGIVIYGQRTLQRTASALDRINVRRLTFMIEKAIATTTRVLVFEQNDPVLWGQFRALVTPFLSNLLGLRALEWFRVICDETTNPPERRNNNEMRGRVLFIPTKTAEVIGVDFTLLPSGADVSEFIQQQ